MDGDRQAVHYGPVSVPGFQTVVHSRLGFGDTLARLQQALSAHDLWLIHEIDPQMLLARGGYDIAPARQLLFFHPRYAARLLVTDPAAVPEIPLKLVVPLMLLLDTRGHGGGANHFFAIKSARDGSIPMLGLKAGSYAPENNARGLPAFLPASSRRPARRNRRRRRVRPSR